MFSHNEDEEGKSQNKETLWGNSDNQTDPTQEKKKLWVNVINENQNPDNGMAIEFVALNMVNGEVEIEIEASNIKLR